MLLTACAGLELIHGCFQTIPGGGVPGEGRSLQADRGRAEATGRQPQLTQQVPSFLLRISHQKSAAYLAHWQCC